MDFIYKVLILGGVMGLLDALWLSKLSPKFYRKYIGKMLLDKPKMLPAVIFYIIYVVGLALLVLNPALDADSLSQAVFMGAIYGLVTYATYDLTNLATIKGFSVEVVVVDMLWGTALTSAVAAIGFNLINILI